MPEQLSRITRKYALLKDQDDRDFFEASLDLCITKQKTKPVLRLVVPGFDVSRSNALGGDLSSIEDTLTALNS